MKNVYIIGIVVILVVISVAAWTGLQSPVQPAPNNSSCTYGQLNYYYRSNCSHCIQVSNDGSLERIQSDFGVEVNKLEVVEWGMYGIYATPTFEFGGQQVKGYKSYDELRQLLGCQPSI